MSFASVSLSMLIGMILPVPCRPRDRRSASRCSPSRRDMRGVRIDARPAPVPVSPPSRRRSDSGCPGPGRPPGPSTPDANGAWRSLMLDDPGKTSRLLAALEAALPFEVHLTPPLARLLRERRGVLLAGDRQTVSALSYLGDAGGIVCHIVPPDGGEVAFVSLTHVRVPPSMPLAAEVLRYQKDRVKKLRKRGEA